MHSSYITLFLYLHKYSDGSDAVFVYEGGWWTNTPYSRTHFISSIFLSVTFSVHFSSFYVRCWTNEVLFTTLISSSCEGAKKCCYTALSESHIYIYIYIYIYTYIIHIYTYIYVQTYLCVCVCVWTAVSACSTFQDPPRLRKTADNTKCCIQGVTGGTDQTSRGCSLC